MGGVGFRKKYGQERRVRAVRGLGDPVVLFRPRLCTADSPVGSTRGDWEVPDRCRFWWLESYY